MTDKSDKTLGKLHVKVLSPSGPLYDAAAVSVTAENEVGAFDVLYDHANFFSLLTPSNVVIDSGSSKITLSIEQGLIKVHNNSVTLFIGIDPSRS